jgi:hypothetical protein
MEDLSRNTKTSACLREDLYELGLGYIWQNGENLHMTVTCQKTGNRYHDIEGRTKLDRMRENKS